MTSSPWAYVPSAAALAALRKPDKSVPRDGGRGQVERRRRRRVINLGCSCVRGTSEAEACPAGHCAGQSPLVSSCLLLLLHKLVSHLITVVCDLTSHVYHPSPPPSGAGSRHISQRIYTLTVSLRSPNRNLVCRRRTFPATHRFQRFSRSRPKTTLACDILCPIMFAAT